MPGHGGNRTYDLWNTSQGRREGGRGGGGIPPTLIGPQIEREPKIE